MRRPPAGAMSTNRKNRRVNHEIQTEAISDEAHPCLCAGGSASRRPSDGRDLPVALHQGPEAAGEGDVPVDATGDAERRP